MTEIDPPFASADVAAAFAAFPVETHDALFGLRALIFDTAADTREVGLIEETLKWGQPSYLTPQTKSGSTLRIGVPKTGGIALYTHCQTSLMSDFRAIAGADIHIEGNRAVHLDPARPLPEAPLRFLIRAALTYHLAKRRSA